MNKAILVLLGLQLFLYGCSSSSEPFAVIPPPDLSCQSEQVVQADENFYINDDADLAAFHAGGYTHVGDVVVSNVTDLSALSCLRSVYHLKISHANIVNLNGLQNLENAKTINVTYCPNLVNFEGLGPVTSVHKLDITGNDNLINLDGLEALGSVSELEIGYNPNLANLDGLSGLTTMFESNMDIPESGPVDSKIYISTNPELVSVAGLNNLANIESLSLYQCPSLTHLGDFDQLTTIGSVLINYCGVASIDCFDNVTDMRGLHVGENAALQSFLFPSLTRVGTLYIKSNPNLNSLQGFSHLTEIYALNGDFSFEMDNNPLLHTLDGLQNLSATAGLVWINPFSENDLYNTCALSLLVNNYLSLAGNNQLDNHISVYSECAGYDGLLYNFATFCQCN
jgi:hypothetical protein